MKTTKLILLLVIPLCCFGEITIDPQPKISMVNFPDGLINTLLDVGTTSFTFSVEWSLDVEIPEKIDLIGKLHLEPGVEEWSFLYELEIDQSQSALADYGWFSRFPVEVDLAQRKATFEILYSRIVWCYSEPEMTYFCQKASFSVITPDQRKTLGLDDDEEEETPTVIKTIAEHQDNETKSSTTNRTHELKIRKEGLGIEDEGRATASPLIRTRLWLCTGIALALCAVFYFVRKKTSH